MSKPKNISKRQYWIWVKEQAARNRLNPTVSEQRVREWFKRNGVKFHFQKPIQTKGKCRDYIVDFVIYGRLIIEVDGETHTSQEARTNDRDRTRRLEREGYKVLRINNEDTDPMYIDSTLLKIIKEHNIDAYNRIIKNYKIYEK